MFINRLITIGALVLLVAGVVRLGDLASVGVEGFAQTTERNVSIVDASNVSASNVSASSVDASSVDASSVDASSVDASSVDASRTPLDVARLLAARYPASPVMSYIPALAWSASFRLALLTGDPSWRDKPRRQMQPFIDRRVPAIAEPFQLPSLAGHLAFADAATLDGNMAAGELARLAADFIIANESDNVSIRFGRSWTDDMFMASSVLSRVAGITGDQRYVSAVGRLLISYAERLQRSDGLFVHAVDAPHAWGRGNGFALLGVLDALTYLPSDWTARKRVMNIYTKQISALAKLQSDDGIWRQVVDDPTSYRELTVTAMTVAAMARGVSRGWLAPAAYKNAINRGWRAVAERVNDDGTVRDVCASTGAGPTREYYLNRPIVNGADDRGGAMVLLAAIEVENFNRSQQRGQSPRRGGLRR